METIAEIPRMPLEEPSPETLSPQPVSSGTRGRSRWTGRSEQTEHPNRTEQQTEHPKRTERTSPPAPAPTPGALTEFGRYRPRPGDPDWPRLQAEADALADTLLPTLARPAQGFHEWRRRLGAHRTVARNYAVNWQRHRRGHEDLLPLYFIWTTHRGCNFRCGYCDDHRGQRYPDLPTDGTLDTAGGKRLLEIMRTRTASVYYAGGEPTLRPDLPELARHARELGYYPQLINTNGSLLHRQLRKPAWSTLLADLDVVVVSLDRLDLQQAAALWRFDDPEAVYRNLLLLRRLAEPLGFKLMVNTVIEPGHVAEARAVLDFANDLGITFCPVPCNVGPRIHPALPGDPAYQAFTETLLRRKRRGAPVAGSLRMNERLLRAAPKTCRNTLKPHVDYDGHLIWPCKSAVNVPPVRVNVLDHPDVDRLYAACVAQVDPTRFCGPGPSQCGAACNWAQNYSTDAYAHGLEHPLALIRDAADFLSR
jgi:MoaA/NifB/PqqE/SkfB family radical SAM enzyme